MAKHKQFSYEEKARFLKIYLEKKEAKEFNDTEIKKERSIKSLLIILECAMVIGLVSAISFNWNFAWMSDINLWLTNIISPLCIYNFLTSIWMFIEKRVLKIKLWIRLLYFFLSLVVTFIISASLGLEFVRLTPLRIIISVVCGILSLIVFALNVAISREEAKKYSEYEALILNEIIDDIDESSLREKV